MGMDFTLFGLYTFKAKYISIMHFIISHNSFIHVKRIGFVPINILRQLGVKVVNMDLV